MKRLLTIGAMWVLAVLANAGTITVTSPPAGSQANPTPVKASTSINFNITGGVTEVTVTATVFKISDNSQFNRFETKVTPNTDGKVSGTLTMTFQQLPGVEVPYRVEIRAVEIGTPNNTYNNVDLFVIPDLTKPKFLQFSPTSGSFVKGIVPIKVRIRETNLKDWRVQVDGQDIANNQGTTVDANGNFQVLWNTAGIQFDGTKAIAIRIRDLADNEETQTINVTIDRVAPQVVIRAPQNNARIAPGTTISISVDVTDFNTSSVDVTGVDVVARRTNDSFIVRASRQSWTNVGGNTMRWTGRIRWVAGQLPASFKLVVTVRDRAGNQATTQTVNLTIG